MNWINNRPENWDEIVRELSYINAPWQEVSGYESGLEHGADAILEALEEHTIDIEVEPWYRTIYDQTFKPSGIKSKGKLIFIPDKE